MKLFCLPYAGASAAIYMKWKKHLEPDAECVPLELAGRGVRSKEPFYEGMEDASEDVLAQLMRRVDGTPYAVFGHSMGGMILYEVARKIRERGLPSPSALIFSGRPSPDTPRKEAPIHELPTGEFADKIVAMGATSKEIFSMPALMNVFVPVLRADFRLVETYRYEEAEPLPWRLTAIAGTEEQWTDAEIESWNRHTSEGCSIVRLPGGHFYWQHNAEPLLDLLANVLRHANRTESFARGGWE